jgi:hypothetical protein
MKKLLTITILLVSTISYGQYATKKALTDTAAKLRIDYLGKINDLKKSDVITNKSIDSLRKEGVFLGTAITSQKNYTDSLFSLFMLGINNTIAGYLHQYGYDTFSDVSNDYMLYKDKTILLLDSFRNRIIILEKTKKSFDSLSKKSTWFDDAKFTIKKSYPTDSIFLK